jgi:predicted dehydrogenase
MEAGKDYFSDKAPFTTIQQLEQARAVAARTGRKYMVYYSERLHNESAMFATDLLRRGAIGRVIHVTCLAPHRLNKASRPGWFFEREKYGGILCDLGSHQFEQFLAYSGSEDAVVTHAAVGNFANPDNPELEDFGEACLTGGAPAPSTTPRVDWFTPDGLSTWGDGRTFIVGTGARSSCASTSTSRDAAGRPRLHRRRKGERHLSVAGKVGFPFFGEFILDCLNRTENAMTQAHAFKAAELCLKAQAAAKRVTA